MDLPILLGRPAGLDEDVRPIIGDELVARVDIGRAFGTEGAGEGPVGSQVEDLAWLIKKGFLKGQCLVAVG